jgi:hypothetical protein
MDKDEAIKLLQKKELKAFRENELANYIQDGDVDGVLSSKTSYEELSNFLKEVRVVGKVTNYRGRIEFQTQHWPSARCGGD